MINRTIRHQQTCLVHERSDSRKLLLASWTGSIKLFTNKFDFHYTHYQRNNKLILLILLKLTLLLFDHSLRYCKYLIFKTYRQILKRML